MTTTMPSLRRHLRQAVARTLLAGTGGLLLLPPPAPAAAAGRERTAFDAGWRFARFGPMPDGSTRPEPAGHELSPRLTALFHREDPTRLVSNGMINAASIRDGFAATLDVAGYNYKAILAKQPNDLDHLQANPPRPFFGAETSSAVRSRGVYFFPVSPKKDGGFYQFQVSSHDLYAPPGANVPDQDFDSADRLPSLAGEFVRTGFDYLGGLCLAVVRPRAGVGGLIALTAKAEGLPPVIVELTAGPRTRVGQVWFDGGDLSALAKIEELGGRFRDGSGQASDALRSLAGQGANCVRLRLFVAPNGTGFVVNDLPYTLALARRARAAGQAILLDFHYSDTWADPAKQHIPAGWGDHSLGALAARIEAHTFETLRTFHDQGLAPELVQIGNEIHNGLLWPVGKIWKEKGQPADYDSAAALFRAAASGVRRATPPGRTTRIVLHAATGGDWVRTETFNRAMQRRGVDYDVIGLSFYPWWHGSIEKLRANCRNIVAHLGKEVMVVETAYLWREGSPQDKSAGKTYAWPPTPEGQAAFLREVIDVVRQLPEGKGIGVVWWHPDALALPGARIWFGGSCALFRPDGTPLPAAAEFARF